MTAKAEINVIWAVDDFTVSNGATLIAPGNRPQPQKLVPAVMPAGSVLVYSGRLWHTAETTKRLARSFVRNPPESR
ncbi:phytanoyl-CoA dioxygenase family protein [Micromonospora deserti]|uniref:Uncharacterized protein n=1 Tax=Micromonospora deserti TaxID=2070366 RepID=A0A2W2BLG4_9ACTN|nr:phytanoyl-CoA dioxygenase family protein [Micromonospora deserti]PZF86180.1 hypothetical protein C1I99_29165 [Micromonospora deserti]